MKAKLLTKNRRIARMRGGVVLAGRVIGEGYAIADTFLKMNQIVAKAKHKESTDTGEDKDVGGLTESEDDRIYG